MQLGYPDGAELLVLAGDFRDAGDHLHAMSWMRVPGGGRLDVFAGDQVARLWIKQGHLRFVDPPAVN